MRFVLLVVLAACGSGGGFPDANTIDSPPELGAFSLQWSVTDASHQPISCAQVGAAGVTVTYHNRAFAGALTEVFNCTTGSGTATRVIVGAYDFDYDLHTDKGTPLATVQGPRDVQITSGQTTALDPVTFTVQ